MPNIFDPTDFREKIVEATDLAEMNGLQIVDAIRIAEEACVNFPSSSRLHCLLGDLVSLSSTKSSMPEKARARAKAIFEQAIHIDPFDPEAYRSLGDLAMLRDCPEEAEELYEKSLSCQEDSRTYLALVSLFSLYENSEKKGTAIADAENYIQIQLKEIASMKNSKEDGKGSAHPVK